MTYNEAKQVLNKMDKIPYPKLQNVMPNPTYAKKLYDSFAGSMGELSAITQYTYEHMNMKKEKEISKIMLSISIVEMRHLNLLGELIETLGLPPHFIDTRSIPWNSKYVKYDTDNLIKTMQYNIFSEKEAIKGYQRAIMSTRNISIQRLLNRIILDEKSHIEIFSRIIKEGIRDAP